MIRRPPSVNHSGRAGSQGRCWCRCGNASFLVTLVVQKYGGTSVADLDRIRSVAARVKRQVAAGTSWSWSCRRWPAPPTSSWAGCMAWTPPATTRPSTIRWSPAASRSRSACWRSRCRPWACRRGRSWAGRPASAPTGPRQGRILEIDRRAGARLPRRGRGRGGGRLPGHEPRRPGDHAGPRRLGHLGGGAGGGARRRALRHLHRRRRRLHHRSQDRRQGAQARPHHLRGDAGDGLARGQGAADPLGGAGHAAPCPGAGALELRGPAGHAGRGRG